MDTTGHPSGVEYINHPNRDQEANVRLMESGFINTCRDIPKGKELLMKYGSRYYPKPQLEL